MSKNQIARRVRDQQCHQDRRDHARSRVLKPSMIRRPKAEQVQA